MSFTVGPLWPCPHPPSLMNFLSRWTLFLLDVVHQILLLFKALYQSVVTLLGRKSNRLQHHSSKVDFLPPQIRSTFGFLNVARPPEFWPSGRDLDFGALKAEDKEETMTRRCKMTPRRPNSGALLDFWMLSGRPTTLSPAVACQAKERYRNSPRWLVYGILHRLELLMYLQFPYSIRTTLYAIFLVAGSTEVKAVDLNRDGWIDFSRGRIQYPYGIYTRRLTPETNMPERTPHSHSWKLDVNVMAAPVTRPAPSVK